MSRTTRREALYGYLFVGPQMLGFLVFVLGPVLAVIVFGFQERNLLTGRVTFVGMANYIRMFMADPLFLKTLFNTAVFTMGIVPLGVVSALGLALLLHRRFAGRSVFRTIVFAPVVTSAVAWAIVWKFLLQGEHGAVNQLLGLFGINGPNWLLETATAMPAVIVSRVIKNVGINVIIFLAAVSNLPEHLYEAARIDGAGRLRTFVSITVPLLAPTILMVTILVTMGSLKVFDHIMLMTAGGPENSTMVLVYYIYYQGFRFFETGYASSLATLLFLLSLILTTAQWSVRRRMYHYED